MTTEDKAREYANTPHCSSINDLRAVMRGDNTNYVEYYAFIAGANSRDAEVAELKAEIKELTGWNRAADKKPFYNQNVLVMDVNGNIAFGRLLENDTYEVSICHFLGDLSAVHYWRKI